VKWVVAGLDFNLPSFSMTLLLLAAETNSTEEKSVVYLSKKLHYCII
jgi:hypothetical protein